MTALRLRPVTRDDARQLWLWCNDGEVRTQAFSARPISWDEHVDWLTRTLSAPLSRMWIAEENGTAIGQFRVDGKGDRAQIDYSIDRGHRGRGLAASLLRQGAQVTCGELAVRVVDALVKESNPASCRAFEKAGYALVARTEYAGHACRQYAWQCGK